MKAAAAARKSRREEAIAAWRLRIVVFALFVAVWELSARRMENLLIPTFTEMVGGFVRLVFVTGRVWEPLLISNQALVLGYLLSVVMGIPLGLAAGRSRWINRLMNPYIGLVLAVPVAPLIPILITALGLGLASRVVLVVLFAFIFITVNTRAGVRNVDPSLIEMAQSFGANEGQIWRKIVIPGAVPAIFAGLRIGLGRAIAGMVIVELLLVATGVGRLLLEFAGRLQADLVFATVFAIIVEAVVLVTAMQVVERKVAPWAHDVALG
ncbi:MAG: ABC transporter permease [Chloroflexi bacterium]|nr:ABC transporter permease [Chloroflexota bacterium]